MTAAVARGVVEYYGGEQKGKRGGGKASYLPSCQNLIAVEPRGTGTRGVSKYLDRHTRVIAPAWIGWHENGQPRFPSETVARGSCQRYMGTGIHRYICPNKPPPSRSSNRQHFRGAEHSTTTSSLSLFRAKCQTREANTSLSSSSPTPPGRSSPSLRVQTPLSRASSAPSRSRSHSPSRRSRARTAPRSHHGDRKDDQEPDEEGKEEGAEKGRTTGAHQSRFPGHLLT